ncbi:hypothetical protein [Neptunomonas japonica]|uniref:hypothetical protein n=1 Tax=Neptunomonas japonica TaxID=417574 RepID=UPI0003FC9668|nr:hypothetical protein [Neptunomonas japonica]
MKGIWKHKRGNSVSDSMHLCARYAEKNHNLSVPRIAELMGMDSYNTLYKWMGSGNMPASKIRSFENACQCSYVTRYIAQSANLLVLDMPTGRKPSHRELNELSVHALSVIGHLISFFNESESSEDENELIQSITTLIEDLAHQRGNVEKHQQPELLLGDES